MKITADLNLMKKELYSVGKEAGLRGATLDGFVMLASESSITFDFDSDNIEIKEKRIK